jgi:hypothetical protein
VPRPLAVVVGYTLFGIGLGIGVLARFQNEPGPFALAFLTLLAGGLCVLFARRYR